MQKIISREFQCRDAAIDKEQHLYQWSLDPLHHFGMFNKLVCITDPSKTNSTAETSLHLRMWFPFNLFYNLSRLESS